MTNKESFLELSIRFKKLESKVNQISKDINEFDSQIVTLKRKRRELEAQRDAIVVKINVSSPIKESPPTHHFDVV